MQKYGFPSPGGNQSLQVNFTYKSNLPVCQQSSPVTADFYLSNDSDAPLDRPIPDSDVTRSARKKRRSEVPSSSQLVPPRQYASAPPQRRQCIGSLVCAGRLSNAGELACANSCDLVAREQRPGAGESGVAATRPPQRRSKCGDRRDRFIVRPPAASRAPRPAIEPSG
jgi:hypothetical protein